DIGKLVLVNHADFDYSNLSHGTHPADELLVLEKQNFNISHDELGARLLSRWEVTDAICDAVRFHHAQAEDIQEAHQLVKILNLSNILASKNILNDPARIEYATELFDLSDSIIRDIVHQSEEEVENVARSMDIDIGNSDTATDNRDEQKQIELAQEVRDITLSRSSRLPGYQDESVSIYQSIQKSIMILFGIKESLIFKCDHQAHSLIVASGHPMHEHSLINDLIIPFESNSLLSQVVNNREIQDSFQSEKLAVVDQQIAGFMKTDGFICIPAIRADQVVALMVLGISNNKHSNLSKNQNLLKLFAQDAASQIEQAETQAKLRDEITANSHNLYRAKAREIIHETNNPLSVIRNYLQLLAKRLDSSDPAQDEIKTIKEEIDRVGTIILRCADVINVEASTTPSQGFEINDLIKDINNIFKSSLFITHNIKSTLHLDSDTGVVYFNKDTIKQIITNLIKNAVEAMDTSGTLDITTRNTNINGRDYIDIEIQDTGPGIPNEILKHLYSPITSTKGKGHSGLGLSIVKNLIDSMGGLISCRTGESGTIFNIQFPRNENR
ncbi:MAG TPA: ATP-binding protein, partial [Gammaproteobacteria bacterium]